MAIVDASHSSREEPTVSDSLSCSGSLVVFWRACPFSFFSLILHLEAQYKHPPTARSVLLRPSPIGANANGSFAARPLILAHLLATDTRTRSYAAWYYGNSAGTSHSLCRAVSIHLCTTTCGVNKGDTPKWSQITKEGDRVCGRKVHEEAIGK